MSAYENDKRQLQQRIERAENIALGVFGGTALMALMLITVVDVLGRNVFNVTVIGAYELSELAVGLVVAAGIPLVALRSDHVYIDLVTNLFRGWLQKTQIRLVLVFTMLGEGVVAWRVWVQADLAAQTHRLTSTLQIPVWSVLYVASALFALAALTTLAYSLKTRGNHIKDCDKEIRA